MMSYCSANVRWQKSEQPEGCFKLKDDFQGMVCILLEFLQNMGNPFFELTVMVHD